MTHAELRDWIIDWVNHNVASVAENGGADPDRPLEELGLSSRNAVSLVGDLEDLFDRNISPTLAWELPTINMIAAELTKDENAPEVLAPLIATAATATAATATATATEKFGNEPVDEDKDLIAVIGVGARLPGGVTGPDSYWQLLLDGRDAVSQVPPGRWDSFFDSTPANDELLARTTRWGGYLDDVAGFDAEFFGISPREAELVDPQQRLLLEVAWEALEHAGINPDTLRGSATGVFVGISVSEYSHLTTNELSGVDAWTATGAALSIAANRLSYLLDLRGPSLAIDTACSSSLVALHTACASLRTGESDTAIVGGVNLLLGPAITVSFDLAGALAADGRCKPFGADADGIVRGEGCGAVIIKRLADARRDGDRILAVIRGSAVNSDGRSNGLTAPNPSAQEAVLRTAYANAGITATDVDYIEAHGTGTLLGDPIEAGALGAVLGRNRDPSRPLLIGSAKSNIGHLEAAAGMAGLIKVVLAMYNGRIPASLHAEKPNPHIRFERDRLKVPTEGADWPRYSGKAVAGVSGFGFGGTNAHIVFEEYIQPVPTTASVAAPDDAVQILTVSGGSTSRLAETAASLADWLADSVVPLSDVAHSLSIHRGHGAMRSAVVGRGRAELIEALRLVGTDDSRVTTGRVKSRAGSTPTGPVWVFSGYGSQWAGMSAKLLVDEPVFAAAMDEVSALVDATVGLNVRAGIESAAAFDTVAQNQVAIFCVQIALAALWRSRGVQPAAIIGHSMGEVAAAVVSGALSLEDGIRVIAVRSALLSTIDSKGAGAMAVVDMTSEDFAEWSPEYPDVTIAVYGSPGQCTVAGAADQVGALVARIEALGRDAWPLKVSGAGHSSAVDPILDDLRTELATLSPSAPAVAVYSTVLENPRQTPSFDNDYWVANARQPVRFTQAVAAAAADGFTTFLEISPHPIAVAALNKTLRAANISDPVIASSLRRDVDDGIAFATNVAVLYVHRHSARLLTDSTPGKFVDVPLTTWRHERFWFITPRRATVLPGHPLLGAHVELPEGGRHLWSKKIGSDAITGIIEVRKFGVQVIPASFYLEIAIEAAAQALKADPASLSVSGLTLETMLARSPETEITTSYSTDTGLVEVFARLNARSPWTLRATATATAKPVAQIDVGVTESARVFVAAASNPTHNPIFAARGAVLDSCLRLVVDMDIPGVSNWSIVSIDTVQVYADITGGGFLAMGDADAEGGRSARLLGEDGSLLAVFHGAKIREITRAEISVPIGQLVYAINYDAAPLSNTVPFRSGTWLLLHSGGAADSERAEQTAERLRDHGHHATVALSNTYDESVAAFGDEQLTGVVLFTADASDNGIDPSTTLLADQKFIFVAAHIAAKLSYSELQRSARLWIVTSGSTVIAADEIGRPGQAALRGLVRTLSLEHTDINATMVDCDSTNVSTTDLVRELLNNSSDDEIVWRNGKRYAARLVEFAVDESAQPPVRDGAYVLSGGLGGLGFALARWLSENGATKLVLVGRNGPSELALAETLGWSAQVKFVIGDINDVEVANRAISQATDDGSVLRGVAHLAAAWLRDELVANLTEEALSDAWGTKIQGALNLHRAALGRDLDWFLTFSSFAAVTGAPGGASYATANAWLDAFAKWQVAQGIPGRAINWGFWDKIGAALDAITVNVLLDAMTPFEALEALGAVLATGRPSTAVALLDAPRAVNLLPGLLKITLFKILVDSIATEIADDEDDVSWPGPDAIRAAEPAVGAAMLMARLRDRIGAVMGATGEKLDMQTPLTEMGFDSLMATRAKNAVEHDLGLAMPIRLVLQGASLNDLGVHLGTELGVDMSSVASAVKETFTTANASAPGNSNDLQLRPDGATVGYIPPRDPTERFLVLIWQDALNRKPIGVNEDFFDLGGDQERADEIARVIKERLGLAPSTTELFAKATIAEMSGLLREQLEGNNGSVVRVLRGTGSRTPVFMFHPAGGPTSVYAPLVSMLNPEQPVYGLERIDDAGTIEEKVARYIPLIREIQPSGPYRLIGWSFGGVLAGETANQLVSLGEEVDVLARIDTIIPIVDPDQELHELLVGRYQRFAEYILETYDKTLVIPYDDLPNMSEDEHIAVFRDALTSVGVEMPPGVLEHQYTSYVDARIAERYQPKLFDGRTILYRASLHEAIAATIDPRYRRTDEKLGWDEYSTSLEVIRVPGDHISMIDRPNVDAIAAHFDGVLNDLAAQLL